MFQARFNHERSNLISVGVYGSIGKIMATFPELPETNLLGLFEVAQGNHPPALIYGFSGGKKKHQVLFSDKTSINAPDTLSAMDAIHWEWKD